MNRHHVYADEQLEDSLALSTTASLIYTCGVCHKQLGSSLSLKRHSRMHSGKRPYRCSICNIGFKQKSTLNRHTLIHTGERRFQCEHCDKRFARKFQLQRHMLVHRQKNSRTCTKTLSSCSQITPSTEQLHTHIETNEHP